MPTLTVNGKSIKVEEGQRLVLAIKEAGVNIGHRCGGHAKCTTCRVVFEAGEPETFTLAEHEKLTERDLLGQYRLACQLTCDQDMSVVPQMTLESEPAWTDTGPDPEETVTPESIWYPKDAFE